MGDRFKTDKIVWNWSGWNEVRKSAEIQDVLMGAANAAAESAGDGYKAVQYPTRVIVVADSKEAERDNLKNNTLLKSGR